MTALCQKTVVKKTPLSIAIALEYFVSLLFSITVEEGLKKILFLPEKQRNDVTNIYVVTLQVIINRV